MKFLQWTLSCCQLSAKLVPLYFKYLFLVIRTHHSRIFLPILAARYLSRCLQYVFMALEFHVLYFELRSSMRVVCFRYRIKEFKLLSVALLASLEYTEEISILLILSILFSMLDPVRRGFASVSILLGSLDVLFLLRVVLDIAGSYLRDSAVPDWQRVVFFQGRLHCG